MLILYYRLIQSLHWRTQHPTAGLTAQQHLQVITALYKPLQVFFVTKIILIPMLENRLICYILCTVLKLPYL